MSICPTAETFDTRETPAAGIGDTHASLERIAPRQAVRAVRQPSRSGGRCRPRRRTEVSVRLRLGRRRITRAVTNRPSGSSRPNGYPRSAVRSTVLTDTNDVRVWLVERTYSNDEQILTILTSATITGDRYFRKERALTSFTDARGTTAALDVDATDLGSVDERDLRSQYAAEATRSAEKHDPDDPI